MLTDGKAASPNHRGAALSLLVHAAAIVAITGVLSHAPRLAPYKLPGTAQGVELLTYYAPGSAQLAQNDVPQKAAAKPKPAATVHSAVAAPAPDAAPAPTSQRGSESSGQSGIGDGDITIALQKYFPYPQPSLSSLPRGAAGDVILTAVIDEHGKVTELTLLQGLGPSIDDQVIQTVNQWTYTPAMKNGVPVSSVQELHFHYQRNG